MLRVAFPLVFGLVLVSCSARTLNVGDEPTGGQCSGATPTSLPTWASTAECSSEPQQQQFLGEWEGSFTGASAADEASTFRLNVTGATESKICGTLTFGVHQPLVTLPPVTGPDEIYPPDSILSSLGAMNGNFGPILGLPYTVQKGSIQGQHVIFFYSLREIFESWCELQTPYALDQNCDAFGCLPGNSGTINLNDPTATCSTQYGPDGTPHYTSCWKVMMCGSLESYACNCNSQHCVASFDSGSMRVIDITFNGEEASGTDGRATQNLSLHRVYTTDN